MKLTTARNTVVIAGASAALAGALFGYALHAMAEGAPTTQPLFYGGLVASKAGVPLEGAHDVRVALFAAESGGAAVCSTPSLQAPFVAGRFRIALPSGDGGCTQAVAKNPDTWSELTVDGTSFPRAKIGALPYAIEADHARSASSLTGPQADTLTQLGSSVSALQAAVPAAVPAAPKPAFKYRFINISNGCVYGSHINSTVCTCAPGEIIVSAGAWAGPTGALNASRAQHGPDDTAASDVDRAREWTFSCVTLEGGLPVQCERVQALCLSI